MKKRWTILCLILLACGAAYLHSNYHLTFAQVTSWKPNNLYLVALLLLILFAVKSVLVFVPIMLLQLLVGHFYPRDIAILLNLLGLMIVMAVPYLVGKKRGTEKIERILKRYPKLQILLDTQEDNQMAFSFMLRACAVPPANIVTMYLGATGMPFLTNVIGGTLGCFPGMMITTFLGANIRNPESPAFWKALFIYAAWVSLSGLSFYLYKKLHSRKDVAG